MHHPLVDFEYFWHNSISGHEHSTVETGLLYETSILKMYVVWLKTVKAFPRRECDCCLPETNYAEITATTNLCLHFDHRNTGRLVYHVLNLVADFAVFDSECPENSKRFTSVIEPFGVIPKCVIWALTYSSDALAAA